MVEPGFGPKDIQLCEAGIHPEVMTVVCVTGVKVESRESFAHVYLSFPRGQTRVMRYKPQENDLICQQLQQEIKKFSCNQTNQRDSPSDASASPDSPVMAAAEHRPE